MQKSRLAKLVLSCATSLLTSSLVMATPFKSHMLLAAATQQPVASVDAKTNQSPQVWNLKNADIRAVIQTMAILTGRSFIIDPQVQGRVTLVSHKPMTVDEMYQVFLSMLRMMNYSAVPSGGVVKIVPSEQANILSRKIATDHNPGMGGDIVVRVVPLNNVSATELVPVIRPLMSQAASVTAYMPSNALILAGTAANISRMVTLIHQMDESNINKIRIIHLRYANASKIVSVIRSLQSADASQGRVSNIALSADENGNNILVSANTANQLLVHRLVDELDQKGEGGDDTRVIKLNYLTAKKIAPILSKVAQGISATSAAGGGKDASAASSLGSNKVSIQAEETNNALIVHAPKAMMNGLLRVVKRLDVRPQEVLVEAIIVKVNESLLNKLGIVWGAEKGGQVVGTGTDGNSNGSTDPSLSPPDNSFQFKINNNGVGFLPNGNLGMLLQLLKSNGASDVLSTPSVVVLNNEKATIDDGQNIGVSNRQYQGFSATPSSGNAAQNSPAFNTIARQNVTLSLAVEPHISPNNMIRMQLTQKDDSLAPGTDTSADGSGPNPTINTSEIQTSVLVRSGDILVLGGLISNEQDKEKQKIPVLGDLPLLGKLFQYNTHKLEKTSLMVFIRPIVMSHRNATAQTKRRYDFIRQEQVNMATEHVVDHGMPMLPKLSKHGPVHLQSPVTQMSLPSPALTVERPRHKRTHRDGK